MRGLTLDTGALIALDRKDRRVTALLSSVLREADAVINIPAGVLAQAFRNGARQGRLTRLLEQTRTRVVALDDQTACVVGMVLGQRGSSDVIDASVVVCARRYRQPVVTSDPEDLHRLDPNLRIEII